MAEYLIKSESLTSIADKVRELSGTTGSLSFDEMTTKIDDANASMESVFNVLASKGIEIPDGANIGDIADLIGSVETQLPELANPAIASELFVNKELIDADGNVVTGTFTIDSELTTQDDLIAQIQTALQNKAAGSEPVLQTKTVTPTTSSQTVTPDSGYDGLSQVTVNGDANLKSENIAEGVSIFGITGTHSGGSGGKSVETCTIEIIDSAGYNDLVKFVFSVILDDGTVDVVIYSNPVNSKITINNVICNSGICLPVNNCGYAGCSLMMSGLSYTGITNVYKAPSDSGAVGTFTIS